MLPRFSEGQPPVVVQQRVKGEAGNGTFGICRHGRPLTQIDADGHEVGPRFDRPRGQFEKEQGQIKGLFQRIVLVGPVAGQFHHCRLFAMGGHHALEQGAVCVTVGGIFLREQPVSEQHAELAFQCHIVAGHGTLEVGKCGVEVVLARPQFGKLKLHQAPIWPPLGQGLKLGEARLQIVGGHEVPGPLQLENVTFGKVFFRGFEELPQAFGVGGLLDQTQGFCSHVFVLADLVLVIAQKVQGRQDVALAQQAVGAFQEGLQIAGPRHHKGGPIFFRAGAVALRQSGEAAVVEDPCVLGFKIGGTIQVVFRRFKALELQVNFAELEVKRHFLGLRIGALQETRVGILQIPLEQVSLAFEVRKLGLLAVGQVLRLSFAQRRHKSAAAEAQAQGQSEHPRGPCRAGRHHPRGFPTVQ